MQVGAAGRRRRSSRAGLGSPPPRRGLGTGATALPPRQKHNEGSVPVAAPQRPPGWASPPPPAAAVSLDLSGIITETNEGFFHAPKGKFSKLTKISRLAGAASSAEDQPRAVATATWLFPTGDPGSRSRAH